MKRLQRDTIEHRVYGKHERAIDGQGKRRGQWVYVGAATSDSFWTKDSPSFLNSWANDPNGGPLRFRHNHVGGIDIQGAVTGGGEGTTIFTLPPDYWPDSSWVIPCGTFDGKTIPMILVNTDGNVSLLSTVGLGSGIGAGGGTESIVDEGTQSSATFRNILLTAKHGGANGNFIHFSAYDITNGGASGQPFKIVVDPNLPGSDQHIKVYLRTDSSGYSQTVTNDLINAINADPVAGAIVAASFTGGAGLLGVYDAVGPP